MQHIKWCEREEVVLFHMFWKDLTPLSSKHVLTIKSFFATQNMRKSKLIVWSNAYKTFQSPLITPFLPFFEARVSFSVCVCVCVCARVCVRVCACLYVRVVCARARVMCMRARRVFVYTVGFINLNEDI